MKPKNNFLKFLFPLRLRSDSKKGVFSVDDPRLAGVGGYFLMKKNTPAKQQDAMTN
jgi:hypothetical protein